VREREGERGRKGRESTGTLIAMSCANRGKGTGKMSECAVGASFGNNNPNLYNRNLDSIGRQ
jgi:hypothetical protein